MPLGEHLRELRKRLLLATAGLVVGTIGGWFLYEPIFQLLQEPVAQLAAEQDIDASLNFSTIASSFDVQLRVAAFLGVLASSPWWMYQLWAFLAPGLTTKERRSAVAFLVTGVPLFAGGVAMAWIALPNTFFLLTQFIPEGTQSSLFIDATVYLKFVVQFLLIFGFAFLLPMVLVALNLLGLVKGITWLKGWRWAVIIIFVLAALATPTADPVTFVLMSLPIVALYFLAVGVSMLNDRRRAKKAAIEDAELNAALREDGSTGSSPAGSAATTGSSDTDDS
ncbi:twin-arginine translocase subunit TatC [Ruania halotolerans]|uniref:twin-arginine translocase subunit TatC n=1 Tax=Ruania halotolerans TaxID=2897773 RepID=UPI001E5D1852|nr:twin-arginine translocase subunit TatC [Ruania halotolerans]UFU08277.1 twin-arginine translocase subunit TatC [Ruania halotolerans]